MPISSVGPNLADRTGRGLETVGPHGLDGIDDHEIRLGRFQRREDLAEICFGCEIDRAFGDLQPLGALLDLGGRLLAGDIDRLHTIAGEPRGDLEQERRFADAGIAADQRGRGWHDAATEDAVELLHTHHDSGRRFGLGIQSDEFGLAGPLRARLGRGEAARRAADGLLNQRVPLATARAFAAPFGVNFATGLAHKGSRRGLGHA